MPYVDKLRNNHHNQYALLNRVLALSLCLPDDGRPSLAHNPRCSLLPVRLYSTYGGSTNSPSSLIVPRIPHAGQPLVLFCTLHETHPPSSLDLVVYIRHFARSNSVLPHFLDSSSVSDNLSPNRSLCHKTAPRTVNQHFDRLAVQGISLYGVTISQQINLTATIN